MGIEPRTATKRSLERELIVLAGLDCSTNCSRKMEVSEKKETVEKYDLILQKKIKILAKNLEVLKL